MHETRVRTIAHIVPPLPPLPDPALPYNRRMRTRTFGRLGWPVSEVGYGLWGVGGWTGSDDAESIAAIERSIALGCTFFDTALAYGQGKSERLLARALASREPGALRIATKIPPKNGKWPALASYALDDVFPAPPLTPKSPVERAAMRAIDLLEQQGAIKRMPATALSGSPAVRYQTRDQHDVITLHLPGPRVRDGVTIVAICDTVPDKLARATKMITDKGQSAPATYTGNVSQK